MTTDRIKARYFRETIGKPDGAVCHMGDCTVFGWHVCTCGLLNDLLRLDFLVAQELYPKFADEETEQMEVVSQKFKKHPKVASLPTDELIGALEVRDKHKDLFIAGKIDGENLILWTVDGRCITAPLSKFKPSGDGTTPDFNDFAIIDWGNTVRFGKYEAAGDAIINEGWMI